MLGIVGVDAKGNVVNKNCGNPCFCCGDKNIVYNKLFFKNHLFNKFKKI